MPPRDRSARRGRLEGAGAVAGAKIDDLVEQSKALLARIDEFHEQSKTLLARIAELEGRAGKPPKTRTNSSLPPSADRRPRSRTCRPQREAAKCTPA
jgi:hypothetical protein